MIQYYINASKKILYLAILLFLFFFSTYNYYQPSKLVLKLDEKYNSSIETQFNLGNGFKPYNVIKEKNRPDHNTVEFQLPQLNIHALKINSHDQNIKINEAHILMANSKKIQIDFDSNFNILNSLDNYNKLINSKLIFIQGMLAISISILFFNIFNLCIKYKNHLNKINFKQLSFIFLPLLVIYFLWFISFYPGLTTNDSWATLSESKTLIFTDWQPYIYTLYVLSLLHFYDSVATIALFQLLLFTCTFSLIFYYVYKNIKNHSIFYIFYFITLLSVPVGIYNNIIWKDIPFSYIVFLFSFLIYLGYKYYLKIGKLHLDNQFIFIIFLLYTGLLHLRHNGLFLAVFIIPFCYIIFDLKSFYKIFSTFIISFLMVFFILPFILNVKVTKSAPLFQFVTSIQIMSHPNYFSKNQNFDKIIIENASGLNWEYIKKNYPHNFYEIWDNTKFVKEGLQFSENGGDTDNYNKKFLLRLIIDNIPIYISYKTFEFFHSIGIDQSRSDATINFFQDPLQLYGSNLSPPGHYQWGVSIEAPIVSNSVKSLFSKIGELSTQYSGFFSLQLIIWSLLIPFLVIFIILWLNKYNKPICFFIYPSLLIAFNVFIVGSGQSWRYFYYIYLCSLFLIPLYFVEKNEK